MFYIHYSNKLVNHKEILVNILVNDPNPNPFANEIILVQSQGMAQWLQLQIATEIGIAGNLQFPYPTSFLWQQYRAFFPELPKENLFERSAMVWRLMRLIPQYLHLEAFSPLAFYLNSPDQLKLYQLAVKVADLFDQYLVYRPHWLEYWEKGASGKILAEISQSLIFRGDLTEIEQSVEWQGILWNALVEELKLESDEVVFNTSHRAYLQQRYFDKLDTLSETEKQKLPQRLFVFGISALPLVQLAVLKKLSEHCDIHLFFANPSEAYWGDQREDRVLEKLALNREIDEQEIQALLENQGNPLLAIWGKRGKEFLNLILEQEPDKSISYYDLMEGDTLPLLSQVKRAILHDQHSTAFYLEKEDRSIQIHACHSKMREVEVLHDQLLNLFEQDSTLMPKDIIVMSADIDSYAPYVDAVFSRYHAKTDKRYIPFALSDQKISHIDPIINGFLSLLNFKNKRVSVDEILDLFNIQAMRSKYQLSEGQLVTLREWIQNSGIRAGLQRDNSTWQNYNSWENGLARLLLGSSLKSENGQWQSLVAFDESYGLNAELVGNLAKFMDDLTAWLQIIAQPQTAEQWQIALVELVENMYLEDADSSDSLQILFSAITQIIEKIQETHFEQPIEIEVLSQCFEQVLNEQRSHLNFLVGKVNFCTLLPMRAIPFKVVCLLGMNEGEFPRQQQRNSFDLMQYAPQKGDRAKREDDRYMFLEALLSAEQLLYISYIGQSLTDNQTKLPSILVSQLLDYLSENLEESVEALIQVHPMTAFSPRNFYGTHFSYDKAWLQAVSHGKNTTQFLHRLVREAREIPSEISLDSLIAYLQDPYRFFFHTQLGVKFEQRDEMLAESEIFHLNGLARYEFYQELLALNEVEQADYFALAKLKGNLPACHFGELATLELEETISPLKQVLEPYLGQSKERFEVEQHLFIADKTIRLFGQISHYIEGEVIDWRVGDLRDKDSIRAWLIFLVLQTMPDAPAFKYYCRQGKAVKCVTFKPLSPEMARSQLTLYVQDYLNSFNELTWVVNEGIEEYLKKASNEDFSFYETENWLRSQENPYIQRILSQPCDMDYEALHQRTVMWFKPMYEHINVNI